MNLSVNLEYAWAARGHDNDTWQTLTLDACIRRAAQHLERVGGYQLALRYAEDVGRELFVRFVNADNIDEIRVGDYSRVLMIFTKPGWSAVRAVCVSYIGDNPNNPHDPDDVLNFLRVPETAHAAAELADVLPMLTAEQLEEAEQRAAGQRRRGRPVKSFSELQLLAA